jgi:MerR family transcriptional regulator, heat shock protein HspR
MYEPPVALSMVADIDFIVEEIQVARTSWRISRMVRRPKPDPTRAVYGISVAADLVGSEPQNLRLYETRGLLTPARSDGGTRQYSEEDLDRLRAIGSLLEAGLNLAGIQKVLELQEVNEVLRRQLEEDR